MLCYLDIFGCAIQVYQCTLRLENSSIELSQCNTLRNVYEDERSEPLSKNSMVLSCFLSVYVRAYEIHSPIHFVLFHFSVRLIQTEN